METDPKFYLELARVTGCTWPWRGEENDPILLVDPIELDPSQFVKLSPRFFDPPERPSWMQWFVRFFQKKERPSWRSVESHCRSVYQSERFYRCTSKEQWLRTVVTCNSSDYGFSVHSIHSNVMPKQAYLTWFEGIKSTCLELQCSLGFFPAKDLLGEMELNTYPRRCCLKCALEDKLRLQLVAAKLVKFRYLEDIDVRVVDDHTEARFGRDGEIHKILWRHGTFARKRFYCNRDTSVKHEFDVALNVSHPNIVHSFGWSDGSSDCNLFMEWLEVDLGRFLFERVRAGMNTPFSFKETLVVLLQVAEAVKHLHEEGFVHGDLKPDNLLLSELAMPRSVENFYLVKLADFGCTRRVDSSGATGEPFSYQIGNPKYTAPEVLRCRKYGGSVPPELLYKIDVYSFGVVAYQVVTGVAFENFPKGFNVDMVMKPDGDSTQWRPSRHFNFRSLRPESLRLLPLIERCWASSSRARPTFEEICLKLRDLYNEFFPEQMRSLAVRRRSSKVPTFELYTLFFFFLLFSFFVKQAC